MMGKETPRSQAERIACRIENYPAIAGSHPVAGETASGYSCATTSVVIVAPTLIVFPYCQFVTEHPKVPGSGKLILHLLRQVELHRQLESTLPTGPSPHQVLKVARALVHRGFKSVLDQVAEERHDVEESALAAGVGSYQHVKAVQADVDVTQTAISESLNSANHGHCHPITVTRGSMSACWRLGTLLAAPPVTRRASGCRCRCR